METRKFIAHMLVMPLALTLVLVGKVAHAQAEFPTKPVRLIVAFPPGQATDIVARVFADELTKIWGKQVVVDNRAGGDSIPGTMVGRNAAPDGYTITFATSSSIAVNPALRSNLPYDPPKDFAMVHGIFTVPWVIIAHPSTPYNTLQEMVSASKKNPNTLNWGYGASSLQLGAELFKFRTGAQLVGVPYKGTGPAITDLLGGHIPLNLSTVAATLPHIKASKVKALATMGLQRMPLLPDVATVNELGYPGFEAEGWGGMVVPKATPNVIVEKISVDVRRVLDDGSVQQRMLDRGVVPDLRGPKEWTKFVHAELVKWTEIARRANVKSD